MLKDVLLGVGITLIIIALILIAFDLHVPSKENDLSNEQIIKKARKIGMAFPGQNYGQTRKNPFSLNTTTSIGYTEAKSEQSTNVSPITIEIPSGVSSRQVANLLAEKNLLADKKSFIKLLTKSNLENKIMAGRYEFNADVSSLELILTLTTK
mgnify:CR=1 FL=1